MLTNTDITIYSRTMDPSTRLDSWNRIYVPEAWWFKDEESSVSTDGRNVADMYTIRISDTSVFIKKDDYIVKGNCSVVMETVKDLEGLDKMRVSSANYNTFGDNPHIKVRGT